MQWCITMLVYLIDFSALFQQELRNFVISLAASVVQSSPAGRWLRSAIVVSTGRTCRTIPFVLVFTVDVGTVLDQLLIHPNNSVSHSHSDQRGKDKSIRVRQRRSCQPKKPK